MIKVRNILRNHGMPVYAIRGSARVSIKCYYSIDTLGGGLMKHNMLLAFVFGALLSSVPLIGLNYFLAKQQLDLRNELDSKNQQIVQMIDEIENMTRSAHTILEKGQIVVTGYLRIIGNEPLTEMAVESNHDLYILSFNQSRFCYPKELEDYQNEMVTINGYLDEWKDFMNRTYNVIDVIKYDLP